MNLAVMAVFVFAVCLAAFEDVRVFKIPNWVSATVAAAFVPYYLLHLSAVPIGMHLLIAAAIFVITVTFWKFRLIGGGDVKLLTAVGLWLGPGLALPFMIYMTGASVVIALMLLLIRKFSWVVYAGVPLRPMLRAVAIAETGKCPYALPIAIAALLTVPQRFL
ncbi:MAG: prepilin peptidase [Gammaproteobacteria bacterium]